MQLYEWTLALIGLLFPDAVWYALEAFQEVFLARMKEEKTSGPRHRPEELTEGMLSTLAAVSQRLQNEEDRQRIAWLTELVRKWPEQYASKAAAPPSASKQTALEPTEAADEPETQQRLQRAASETYREMKRRQQEEINTFPMAFAFSKTQLAEGMWKLGLQPTIRIASSPSVAADLCGKQMLRRFTGCSASTALNESRLWTPTRTGDGFLLEVPMRGGRP